MYYIIIKNHSILFQPYATYSLLSVLCIVPVSKFDEFEKILKYMRPLISKIHFKKPLKIGVNQPQILWLAANLLEGSSAEELRINAFDDRYINRMEIADLYVLKCCLP